jgi:hypothetical protein
MTFLYSSSLSDSSHIGIDVPTSMTCGSSPRTAFADGVLLRSINLAHDCRDGGSVKSVCGEGLDSFCALSLWLSYFFVCLLKRSYK